MAWTDVILTITAVGDLDVPIEYLSVELNGEDVGDVFVVGGNSCPDVPDVAELVIPRAVFDELIAGGQDADFSLIPSEAVDVSQCIIETWATIEMHYDGLSPNDLNFNGVPDDCEVLCLEDVNGDGLVDVLDLLAVIIAWGQMAVIEDVNRDEVVDVLDLLAVITAWGPCE
jgi:hypothetical protein